jgi:hypothetical protein
MGVNHAGEEEGQKYSKTAKGCPFYRQPFD